MSHLAGIPPRRTQLRRTTLLTFVAVAVALAAAACGRGARPNVLLLVLDTTRADRCSFTGCARPTTPRIDEFAKDAMVFTDAWSPANWTGPAHASLFTGLTPVHHGFHDGWRPNLGAGPPTIAERFSGAGYATACFTNNEFVSPDFGLTRGFQRFEPLYLDANRPYPWARATHDMAATWAEEQHAAGKPFLLFINDLEPHLPYTPPEDVAAAFLRGTPSAEEVAAARAFPGGESLAYTVGVKHADARELSILSDLYDGEIAALDREVGRLLDRFRTSGLLDDTVVVIVGDHGEELGEHGIVDHAVGLYRNTLHVPLLLRFPNWFDRGRSVSNLVRLEDVAPTLLEVCRLDPIANIDGVPLTRDLSGRVAVTLQGANGLVARRAARLYPGVDLTALSTELRSVYDGAYHLIAHAGGRCELYDTVHDPDEAHDISAAKPGEVGRLLALVPDPGASQPAPARASDGGAAHGSPALGR